MQLTGLILFFGSIFAMFVWLYSLYKTVSSIDILFRKEILGQKIEVNVLLGIAIFICTAISAGMAWGGGRKQCIYGIYYELFLSNKGHWTWCNGPLVSF